MQLPDQNDENRSAAAPADTAHAEESEESGVDPRGGGMRNHWGR